jgi:hypothetical protein
LAFDKTPEKSTYQTKKIKLVKELNSRGTDTSKDETFVNFIPELIKNKNTKEDELYLIKRPGSASFIATVATENTRGMFFWEAQNRLFVAVNNDVRIYNASTAALVATHSNCFGTTSGEVGFCEFLYDTGAVKIVITDGTTMLTSDSSNTLVTGADADMPVHLPYPVFLDGYLFIIKSGTADLYNSNLNDPLAYTAGDFITAEMLPDTVNCLSRLNNYLVVFGNQSIEYFWDAAIATGSPLQRNDTPIKLSGLLGGIARLGNQLFVVAAKDDSAPDVYIMEDFKLTSIGTEAIKRHLTSITVSGITSFRGGVFSEHGHDMYLLNTGTLCYCYDVESKLWTEFRWQTSSVFNFIHLLNAETAAGYKTFFSLSGDSVVYNFSRSLYQDAGTTFPAIVITDQHEFDTYHQKTMGRLVVWADKPSATSTGSLQWTDDDYQSYNTAVDVDLYHERPSVTRLGRFRRRAFKWTYTQNQPHRLKAFEVEINMGAN